MQDLAPPSEKPTEGELETIFSRDIVPKRLAKELSTPFLFMGLLGTTPSSMFSASSAEIELEIDTIRDIEANKVDGSTWTSARVRWTGKKTYSHVPVIPPATGQNPYFPLTNATPTSTTSTFTFDTTILVQLSSTRELEDVELVWTGPVKVTSQDSQYPSLPAPVWTSISPTSFQYSLNYPQIEGGEPDGDS